MSLLSAAEVLSPCSLSSVSRQRQKAKLSKKCLSFRQVPTPRQRQRLDSAQGHDTGRLHNVLILYSEADEISQRWCLFVP